MEKISIKEIVAELEGKFPVLAEHGEIDRDAIFSTVLFELRKFGVDALSLRSDVIHVSNYKATLPKDFKSLKEANGLILEDCFVNDMRVGATDNYVYREYIMNPARYNESSGEYETFCETNIVTEKITIGSNKLRLRNKRKPLELVDSMESNSIASDCVNKGVKSDYKISINELSLKSNFKDGKIHIVYYGLPKNSEGDIAVPLLSTGSLYQYIENRIKISIIEYMISNNLNPQGLSQLLNMYLQNDRVYKDEAMKEVKFHGFKNSFHKKHRANNIARFNKYNPYRRCR